MKHVSLSLIPSSLSSLSLIPILLILILSIACNARLGVASALDLDAIVAEVNSASTTWKAAVPLKFQNATSDQAKRHMGTILKGEPNYLELPAKTKFGVDASALPESFDARVEWPSCASVIGHVRDQGSCGSCWAFGSTEAFNDRLCMKTGSLALLSPTDTVSCCTGYACGFSMGCNGGQPSGAWKFFTTNGVSTGGDYSDVDTGNTCKPYPFPPCAHHVDTTDYDDCGSADYSTPSCTKACTESTYETAYKSDKTFAATSYSVKTEANIMQELYEFGTVTVSFSVYDDFLTYTSGVYQHVTGSYLGGHAVKMIGWGVEDGTPYWLCVNSWNDSWGDKGTFKIMRGSNECGIEGSVVAGAV